MKKAVLEVLEQNKKIIYDAISKGNLVLIEETLKKLTRKEIQADSSMLLYKAIRYLEDIEAYSDNATVKWPPGYVGTKRVEMIELLLKYGVTLNVTLKEANVDYTPLRLAMHFECLDVVQLLVNLKIEITPTYLWRAKNSRWYGKALFNIFLGSNTLTFDPDKTEHEGYYFRVAIEEGHLETVKRTIDKLDPEKTNIYSAIDDKGHCIVQSAVLHKRTDIAVLLLNFYLEHREVLKPRSACDLEAIFYSAVRQNEECIVIILLQSPYCEEISLSGERPHCTVRNIFLGEKKEVIASSLYHAMRNENESMAELLLRAGVTFGEHIYTKDEFATIDKFNNSILTLYSDRTKKLRESLDPAFPAPLTNLISEYLKFPEIPEPKVQKFK